MENILGSIDWTVKDQVIAHLLNEVLTTHPLDQGFEAEVVQINTTNQESFVLKIWNKHSKPDVKAQFLLLNRLLNNGVSVSKPAGCGVNHQADPVLLTSFDGTPLLKLNDAKLAAIAHLLSQIHNTPIDELDTIPKPNFIEYFYPRISEFPDLYPLLLQLTQQVQLNQDRIIHGDLHLRNIVENAQDQLTVIDWTNGQLGDSRYDFAWSLLLMRLYISDKHAAIFSSAYLTENHIQQEELEVFEAIACLRWILLNRSGHAPRETNTLQRMKSLIQSNRLLKNKEFYDLPIKKKVWDSESMNIEAVFGQFPILESADLILKKIEIEHLEEIYEIYSNDTVFEYCGIIPKHNKETVKSMIGHFDRDFLKKSKIKWGIFTHDNSNQLVGIIEAVDFNQKVSMANIGYFLAEAHWGKGMATKAVELLVDFLFNKVNLNRIQAEVMPPNELSKKVLLKTGFIKEGTLRQAALWSGKGIVDLEIYGILKEEYVKSAFLS